MHRFLLIDNTFRDLNIPLQPDQYQELERQIKKNNTSETFPVWHGFLLTEYARYNLMLKYHRHYTCKEISFTRKTEAIAWICREQLKRTDLTKPATYWLLYRLYEALLDAEKRIKAKDQFQYKQLSPSLHFESTRKEASENTAVLKKVGGEFHFDKLTIRNYVKFGRQLDRLEEMFPGIRNRILTGKVDVARIYMDALMEMPQDELRKMINDPQCKRLRPPEHIANEILQHRECKRKRKILVDAAIKKTPEYDPDSELNGLTYTIGAWVKTLSRTSKTADLPQATLTGKERLQRALCELSTETDSLYRILEGSKNE